MTQDIEYNNDSIYSVYDMSQNDYIIMRGCTYYLGDGIWLLLGTIFIFAFILALTGDFIDVILLVKAFVITEILILALFFYHMRYPVSFIHNGRKYTRMNACLKKELEEWHPIEEFVWRPRLFLYALGFIKTIIIAKCKETGDIKVQCPYCKHVMDVEDVPCRCPQCNRKMHDDTVVVTRL